MNKDDPNVARVELVAKALGDTWTEFVLVGGCAAGLLITDQARPPVRATVDVDLAVEVATRADYYNRVHEQLLKLGFTETGDILCRWRCGALIVDVMPTEEDILGFANRWYRAAVRTAQVIELPSGAKIKVITAPLFVATKLEAFFGRGKGGFDESHDIEDIVNVVDGRAEWVDEVAAGRSSSNGFGLPPGYEAQCPLAPGAEGRAVHHEQPRDRRGRPEPPRQREASHLPPHGSRGHRCYSVGGIP